MVTDNATGEMFCGNCGYVLNERIEESGPEWRAFSKEEHEDRSRTGIPTSLAMHDMGLATIIGPVDKDASGKPLSASMRNTIERLRVSACGPTPLTAAVASGKIAGGRVKVLKYANSGDVTGEKAWVVGYPAVLVDRS